MNYAYMVEELVWKCVGMLSAKIVCVYNLESMLQQKQESNDKVCAGIEFACVCSC
jgi:hypothetical protein